MEKRKKVLYVDDDERALNIVAKHLISSGYQVFTSSSPFVSPILEKEKPDLIILDIEMPLLSGPKLAEILTNQLYADSIPIVFFSGKPSAEVEEIAEQTVNATYVTKKSGLESLLQHIDTILA